MASYGSSMEWIAQLDEYQHRNRCHTNESNRMKNKHSELSMASTKEKKEEPFNLLRMKFDSRESLIFGHMSRSK